MIDPYVEVRIRGHEDDFGREENKKETKPVNSRLCTEHCRCCCKVFSTELYVEVRNNGFNPTWGETFQLVVSVPDLAILELKVRRSHSHQFK